MSNQIWEVAEENMAALRRSGIDRVPGAVDVTNALRRTVEAMRKLEADYQARLVEIAEQEATQLHRPEGILEARARLRTEAEAKLDELADRAESMTVVLQATVETQALPKVDPNRELADRDEVKMILDGAPDERVGQTLAEIATGPRPNLAGITVSHWTESYLRARGLDGDSYLPAVRTAAAKRAAEHGQTDEARHAGSVIDALHHATKGTVAATAFVRQSLEPQDNNGRA